MVEEVLHERRGIEETDKAVCAADNRVGGEVTTEASGSDYWQLTLALGHVRSSKLSGRLPGTI